MNILRRTSFILVALVLASACTSVEPDAGTEVILTYKPAIFGSNGVDPKPIGVGRTYIALSTQATAVDMKPNRVDLEFDDMMTKSGVPVDFHVVLTFRVTDSVKMVTGFGADRDSMGGWGFFGRNLEQPIRTAVRDAVKKRDMQEMAITATAVDAVQEEVLAATRAVIAASGVPIAITVLNVGRVNPPDAIKHQRVETAAQEQRLITEQQRKLAEDQRKLAEESRADADNAYNQKMHLNPEQYVQLEHIKMLRESCVGGKCTFFLGAGATPVLPIR